jgi:hypothetical protein
VNVSRVVADAALIKVLRSGSLRSAAVVRVSVVWKLTTALSICSRVGSGDVLHPDEPTFSMGGIRAALKVVTRARCSLTPYVTIPKISATLLRIWMIARVIRPRTSGIVIYHSAIVCHEFMDKGAVSNTVCTTITVVYIVQAASANLCYCSLCTVAPKASLHIATIARISGSLNTRRDQVVTRLGAIIKAKSVELRVGNLLTTETATLIIICDLHSYICIACVVAGIR